MNMNVKLERDETYSGQKYKILFIEDESNTQQIFDTIGIRDYMYIICDIKNGKLLYEKFPDYEGKRYFTFEYLMDIYNKNN